MGKLSKKLQKNKRLHCSTNRFNSLMNSNLQSTLHYAANHLRSGNLETAEKGFRSVLQALPNNPDAICGLAIILAKNEKYEKAEKLLKKAIQLTPGNPSYYNNLGNCQKNLGKLFDAQNTFQKCVHIKPDFFDAHFNLGNVLTRQRKFDQAFKTYQRAIDINPKATKVYIHYGKSLNKSGRLEEAFAAFEKALEIDSNCVDAYVQMSNAYELASRFDEAKIAADKAYAISPFDHNVLLSLGKIEYRLGNYTTALKLISEIIQQTKSHNKSIDFEAYFIKGQILRKIEQYENSYLSFQEGNQSQYSCHKKTIQNLKAEQKYYAVDPSPLKQWFCKSNIDKWFTFQPSESSDNAPVFMTGFSRSGTTLIDQVLDSHPNVITLEEKPTINNILEKYCSQNSLQTFINLSEKKIRKGRLSYWETVKQYIKPTPEKIFIDRSPFNTIYLGHIHRFFPDSKIIIALRDPRDVVLSNFMQSFVINEYTLNFTSLEDTAKYFASVMDLFHLYRSVLPLNIHFVCYENIVEDFESEVKKILDFLEIEWSDNVTKFYQTARGKHLTTASYHQVVQPIYKSAVGRWQNYQKHLEPVMPILQPYIDIFENERAQGKNKQYT